MNYARLCKESEQREVRYNDVQPVLVHVKC